MLRKIHRVFSLIAVLASLGMVLASPRGAAACGGFFCRNVPISQSAERIIFAVDTKARVVTSVIGINYTGDAAEFSWVVPVPSVPELDVAESKSLDHLADATNMVFNLPRNLCPVVPIMEEGEDGGGGGGGAPPPQATGFLKTGSVGPFDYAIIRNEKTDSMVAWLRENKYRVTEEMEPLVAQYVKEGQYFLAMKLKRGKDVSEIKPIVMTYTGVNPAIPIRLTAVAANPKLQLLVWILGGARFVPQNYVHADVDFTRMRAGIIPVVESGSQYLTLNSYEAERQFIQDRYNGQAFITEYAQPIARLMEDQRLKADDALDPVVSKLLARYPYITRLRGQMNPDQMTVDPMFVADGTAPDVSNVVNIENYVDPKTFWGCQ